MGFFGRSFTFDSTPCELYDLMLYDIDNLDSDIPVSGYGSIEEETVGEHWRPYFYGVRQDGKLEFDITFGVNERRIDKGKFLDRWEIAEVTSWLCGHSEYKWLFVDQPDMRPFGYRCLIRDPKITRYGSVPWAVNVHVVCDSPYAYMEPIEFRQQINGSSTFTILNDSSLNKFYYPIMTFTRYSGDAFSVKNEQDNNKGPEISGIPGSVSVINIDNEHCVITNDQDLNLYEGFNFQFLRLAKGYNRITATGNGILDITCEFPVNIGG